MRCILYIGILFSAVSCGNPTPKLRTGDLLFEAGNSSAMAAAITDATGEQGMPNFTHVGIAVTTEGADSVLEASTEGGVRMTALAEFLKRAAQIDGKPAVVAMRLRDTTGVTQAVARAGKFIGQPYDYSYLPGNGRLYCSELVWESYLTEEGTHRFAAQPMNFRAADGTLPRFWVKLFAQQGEAIPEGIPGTNPNDMAQDSQLQWVGSYYK